jgi:hypothetical protein
MYPRDCEAPCTSGTYVPHFGKSFFNQEFGIMTSAPCFSLLLQRPHRLDFYAFHVR